MIVLIKLELKSLIRHPTWLVLLGSAAWLFAVSPTIEFYLGLEHPLFELLPLLPSAGQWGRNVLLMIETWGGILFSVLVALHTTRALAVEHRHREVLWATQGGGRPLLAKFLATSTFATVLIVLGAALALPASAGRDGLVQTGIEHVPLYVFLAWVRIAVWVAMSMFFYSLFRSRWWSIAHVGAVQVTWFGTAGIWADPSHLRLLHRSLLSWNFISVFTPRGILPGSLLYQLACTAGTALGMLGAAVWARGRLPEWKGPRPAAALGFFALGTALLIGGLVGLTVAIRNQTAPYTAEDLWDGRARLEQPYLWSRDFRLLVHPSPFLAARLPRGSAAPPWLAKCLDPRECVISNDSGTIILRGHLGSEKRIGDQQLVVGRPAGQSWPRELNGLVARLQNAVRPVICLASALLGAPLCEHVAVLFPKDATPIWIDHLAFCDTKTKTLHVHYPLLFESTSVQRGHVAWAVSAPLVSDGVACAYVALYLMLKFDPTRGELVLARLKAIRDRNENEFFRRHGRVYIPPPILRIARAPRGAAEILQHWYRGEELGHEIYIAQLLGRKGE